MKTRWRMCSLALSFVAFGSVAQAVGPMAATTTARRDGAAIKSITGPTGTKQTFLPAGRIIEKGMLEIKLQPRLPTGRLGKSVEIGLTDDLQLRQPGRNSLTEPVREQRSDRTAITRIRHANGIRETIAPEGRVLERNMFDIRFQPRDPATGRLGSSVKIGLQQDIKLKQGAVQAEAVRTSLAR